jgi:hypothetical protein
MFDKYLRSIIALTAVFFSSHLLCISYPEKILIKNTTSKPITYAIKYRARTTANIAFVWLEPGEEQNITEDYYLSEGKLHYLHIAINKKDPSDMRPFSSTDSTQVYFSNQRAVVINVFKQKNGVLSYWLSPVSPYKNCRY